MMQPFVFVLTLLSLYKEATPARLGARPSADAATVYGYLLLLFWKSISWFRPPWTGWDFFTISLIDDKFTEFSSCLLVYVLDDDFWLVHGNLRDKCFHLFSVVKYKWIFWLSRYEWSHATRWSKVTVYSWIFFHVFLKILNGWRQLKIFVSLFP